MVITVRTILVGVFEFLGVLAEALLAFLAGEDHFVAFEEWVVLGLLVAFCAVKPFSACVQTSCQCTVLLRRVGVVVSGRAAGGEFDASTGGAGWERTHSRLI